MATLESVVLPLEQSRALAEKVKLDTALSWYEDTQGKQKPVVVTRDFFINQRYKQTGAPTLSELLDAIRVRCSGNIGFAHFHDLNGQYVWQVWWGESELLSEGQAHGEGESYLLAACALLREVSR